MGIIMKGQAKGWFPERDEVCESLYSSRESPDGTPQYRLVTIVGYDSWMEQVQFIPFDGPFARRVCAWHQQADYYGDMQFRRIQK